MYVLEELYIYKIIHTVDLPLGTRRLHMIMYPVKNPYTCTVQK